MESFRITGCFLHQLIFLSVEIQGFWLLLNYIETRKSLMTFFFGNQPVYFLAHFWALKLWNYSDYPVWVEERKRTYLFLFNASKHFAILFFFKKTKDWANTTRTPDITIFISGIVCLSSKATTPKLQAYMHQIPFVSPIQIPIKVFTL